MKNGEMQVGFIGLGLMGRPMALNLRKAGYSVGVWARREASLQPLLENGAQAYDSPAALAKACDVIITMVADAADVEDVALGKQGIIHGAEKGLIVVDMSTIAPEAARAIAERFQHHGVIMLDAPVSGGEIGAINAQLTVMVGGERAAFFHVLPLLEKLGKNVSWIGESGSGQVAKACNQILTGVGVLAVAEALRFAQASGVDGERVRSALLGGFASSKILENHGERMLKRNFKPGFKAWMHQKDMNIVLAEAQRMMLSLPASEAAAQMMNALVEEGLGTEDSIAVLKLLEKQAEAITT